jgi:hypothetical protein
MMAELELLFGLTMWAILIVAGVATVIELINWAKCLCKPEDYPEDTQTNPRCPEHNPKGSNNG